jgi:hypothetical protein
MTAALSAYVFDQVPTVPAARNALIALNAQLDTAATYDEIRKIERAAEAMRILFNSVDDIKHECEVVILDARARIGN